MTKVRLIDANALKQHICNMCDDGQRECKGDESCALLVWVNDMPTIEAEPVRHGRWIDNGNDKYICSSCKGYVYRWFGKSDLCPNCGARMDLRTQTEAQLDIADSVMMGGVNNDT